MVSFAVAARKCVGFCINHVLPLPSSPPSRYDASPKKTHFISRLARNSRKIMKWSKFAYRILLAWSKFPAKISFSVFFFFSWYFHFNFRWNYQTTWMHFISGILLDEVCLAFWSLTGWIAYMQRGDIHTKGKSFNVYSVLYSARLLFTKRKAYSCWVRLIDWKRTKERI